MLKTEVLILLINKKNSNLSSNFHVFNGIFHLFIVPLIN